MQIIDSTPAALSADLQMYLRNGDVFFDIETTGLSWRTSHLYPVSYTHLTLPTIRLV